MGFGENKDLYNASRDIKTTIMTVLEEIKKNGRVEKLKMETIYCNISLLDHHDAVRLDQILTILANKNEQEYQWASICMGRKFESI